MIVDPGGAAAPAAPASDAVIPTDAPAAPNAITNEGGPANMDAPPAPAAKPVSIDDALDRAAAKVEGRADGKDGKSGDDDKGAKPAKADQPRENGRFAKDPAKAGEQPADGDKGGKQPEVKPAPAAKPAAGDAPPAKPAADPNAPKLAAPARFSEDAKGVWETAPEPIKAEVHRMERELTAGIEKHKANAAKFENVREFDEMATKSGTDLKTALTRYTQLEGLLRQNPMKGLEEVCNNIGVSLRQVAEIVLGQEPDKVQAQNDATIRDLNQKIARLEQQVGGVVDHSRRQGEAQLEQHITDWAKGWDHFEVFAPHIAAELQAGAQDLDAAYEAVLQKHPGLASLAKKAKAATPAANDDTEAASKAAREKADLEEQTRRGQKSITGAPSQGSNPAAKKRSKSIDEAIDAAFAAAG